ncbi:MAG: hypothetical protein OCC49_16150 [Fibrobacterales bacterium]
MSMVKINTGSLSPLCTNTLELYHSHPTRNDISNPTITASHFTPKRALNHNQSTFHVTKTRNDRGIGRTTEFRYREMDDWGSGFQ